MQLARFILVKFDPAKHSVDGSVNSIVISEPWTFLLPRRKSRTWEIKGTCDFKKSQLQKKKLFAELFILLSGLALTLAPSPMRSVCVSLWITGLIYSERLFMINARLVLAFWHTSQTWRLRGFGPKNIFKRFWPLKYFGTN